MIVVMVMVVVVVMFMCEIRIVFNAIASVKHRAYTPFKLAVQLESIGRMVKYVEWFKIGRGRTQVRMCVIVYEWAIERVNRMCSNCVCVCVCQFSYQTNRNNFNKNLFVYVLSNWTHTDTYAHTYKHCWLDQMQSRLYQYVNQITNRRPSVG